MQNFWYDVRFSVDNTHTQHRENVLIYAEFIVYWKWAETKEKLSDFNIISGLDYS